MVRGSSLLCLVCIMFVAWDAGYWSGKAGMHWGFSFAGDSLRTPGTVCRNGTPCHVLENRKERFWQAYAADRRKMLSRIEGQESQLASTKYIVFVPTDSGLGNHMMGMMSTFVLSIAFGRIFLHSWDTRMSQCGATYDDLFQAPFEPWSSNDSPGSRVSNAEGLLTPGGVTSHDTERWGGLPASSGKEERARCTLDLTQKGVESGAIDRVFIARRGRDPLPDCRVLYVTTNQYFVQVVSDLGYGNPKVGGTPLADWLQGEHATEILTAGLFRPVDAVVQRVQKVADSIFSAPGQNELVLAAHARDFQLRQFKARDRFSACLEEWARAKNASTVIVATDIPGFIKDTRSRLHAMGVKVRAIEGVSRLGESKKMRDTVEKVQTALAELLLVSKGDIMLTSPKSSFSALAAAVRGPAVQRIAGNTCQAVENVPEFHLLGCGMKWELDFAVWSSVYSFADANRERCHA